MTPPDPIKDAFLKVKQDMDELKTQIWALSQQIEDINRTIQELKPTEKPKIPTIQQINPTIQQSPTANCLLYAPISQDMGVSIGNRGVPTDSQADSQADSQTDQKTSKTNDFILFHPEETPDSPPRTSENAPESSEIAQNPVQTFENSERIDKISQIQRVSQVLESLDSIKKEIRSNFKHLTAQEMAVFSAIYTFEEQGFVVDYSLISGKLSLSESSIRDYTHKLIKKGIPILKSKENNKKVTLQISPDLKKIASLQTILSLRNL